MPGVFGMAQVRSTVRSPALAVARLTLPGRVRVTVGGLVGVVSTVHVNESPSLGRPAARTANVCCPAVSPVAVKGVRQLENAPPSSWHSNAASPSSELTNWNVAAVEFVGLAGLEVIWTPGTLAPASGTSSDMAVPVAIAPAHNSRVTVLLPASGIRRCS